MNAKNIAWRLATNWSSPYRARTQIAVVPNVSWALLPWEADLVACSKAGFLTEIEIKISLSDWKADFSKKKFVMLSDRSRLDTKLIKYFYYAAPEELANRFQELDLPPGSGVISVSEKGIKVLKKSEPREGHRRLTDSEIKILCRLGALKAWDGRHHPEFQEPIEKQPELQEVAI